MVIRFDASDKDCVPEDDITVGMGAVPLPPADS